MTTKGRTTAKVIFLHGLEGSPNGTKAKWLRKHFDLVAPEMDTSSVDAARPGALGALQGSGADADLLIGSSFGGAMAMRLVSEGHWSGPVVLLAPAVRFAEDVVFEPEARVAVVHGRADKEVLWPSVLERFAQAGEGVQLFLGGWEHRLGKALDDGSIRRAIHWALDYDVLSRGEQRHAHRSLRGEWPADSDPASVEAFRQDAVAFVEDGLVGPARLAAQLVSEGAGLSKQHPLQGVAVAELHALIGALGWRFLGNRSRTAAGGPLIDRLYVAGPGSEKAALILHAIFPGASENEGETDA